MVRELVGLVKEWWKVILLYSLLTAVYAALVFAWSSYYFLSCQWCRHRRKHDGQFLFLYTIDDVQKLNLLIDRRKVIFLFQGSLISVRTCIWIFRDSDVLREQTSSASISWSDSQCTLFMTCLLRLFGVLGKETLRFLYSVSWTRFKRWSDPRLVCLINNLGSEHQTLGLLIIERSERNPLIKG